MAHTACSGFEPQPKLFRATKIDAPLKRGAFREKSVLGFPSAIQRQSKNSCGPNPVREMDLRNCFGMIWSVSTLARSRVATIPLCDLKDFIDYPRLFCENFLGSCHLRDFIF